MDTGDTHICKARHACANEGLMSYYKKIFFFETKKYGKTCLYKYSMGFCQKYK